MNKSERLRGTVILVGKRIQSNGDFMELVQSQLLEIIKSDDDLESEMPELIEIYASEFFLPEDYVLFRNNGRVFNIRTELNKEQLHFREAYRDKPILQRQIDYFKKMIRKSFSFDKSCGIKTVTSATLTVPEQENTYVEQNELSKNAHVKQNELPKRQTRSVLAATVDMAPIDIASVIQQTTKDIPICSEAVDLVEVKVTKKPQVKSSKKRKRRESSSNLGEITPTILWFLTNKLIVKTAYRAYVEENFGMYSTQQVLEYFEETGFVSISMVDTPRQINSIEQASVDVFEFVRLKFTKELMTNGKRRLINQPNGGALCDEFTCEDDLRRAVSITFGPSVRELQILVDYFVQQFVNIGLIHPNSKAGNALGKDGLELLFKGPGLEEQVPHYDFPRFKDTNRFLSFSHSTKNKLKFDETLDGGVSLFVNHTNKTDYLRRPDGLLIMVPKYSYCILRGNVAHSGTGNSTDDAVFKFFCYIDPVKYDRANNKYRDSVFLFDEFRQIVRMVAKPCTVKLVTKTVPYLCVYCFGSFHYTNPICMGCLHKHWRVKLSCTSDNSLVYTYKGQKTLKKGFQFPDSIVDGFIRKDEYKRRYDLHFGGEVIGCISVSETHYLSYLEHKSMFASMKKHLTNYNVELVVFESSDGTIQGVLCVTSDTLRRGEELVLRADPRDQNSGVLMIDPDDYAIKDVNDYDDNAKDAALVRAMKSGMHDPDEADALQTHCLNLCSSDDDDEISSVHE